MPPGEEGTRYTTPSYVFSRDTSSVSVPGFQPLEAYEVALQNLAPELQRRPKAQAGELLCSRPGELLATVEIAAAIGRSARRTVEQLDALVSAEPVQRTVAGVGELWSWGAPAVTLECPPLPVLPARLQRELTA